MQFLNPDMQNPYSMRWNFGIQQKLSNNMMLEVVYIGNHSIHLPVNVTQVNGIPRQYLSTYAARDAATNYLTSSVPNPFAGLNTSQNGTSTTPAQLLARFPQFPVGDSAGGWSGTGGVLELNQRYRQLVFPESQRPAPEADFSRPDPDHQLHLLEDAGAARVAERFRLPVGASRIAERSSAALRHQRGIRNSGASAFARGERATRRLEADQHLLVPARRAHQLGQRQLHLARRLCLLRRSPEPQQSPGGRDGVQQVGIRYQLDTVVPVSHPHLLDNFGNLRADGINQLDSSIIKTFRFSEQKRYFQLRAEMFNVPNHPVFAAPNTTATNSAFGTISATVNRFRTMQLSARIVF